MATKNNVDNTSNVLMTRGVKTSEFWTCLATNVGGLLTAVIGLLVMFGKVSPENSGKLTTYVVTISGIVVSLVSSFVYTYFRTKVKTNTQNSTP